MVTRAQSQASAPIEAQLETLEAFIAAVQAALAAGAPLATIALTFASGPAVKGDVPLDAGATATLLGSILAPLQAAEASLTATLTAI